MPIRIFAYKASKPHAILKNLENNSLRHYIIMIYLIAAKIYSIKFAG